MHYLSSSEFGKVCLALEVLVALDFALEYVCFHFLLSSSILSDFGVMPKQEVFPRTAVNRSLVKQSVTKKNVPYWTSQYGHYKALRVNIGITQTQTRTQADAPFSRRLHSVPCQIAGFRILWYWKQIYRNDPKPTHEHKLESRFLMRWLPAHKLRVSSPVC